MRRAKSSKAQRCTTSSELFLVSEKPADQMPFRSFSMAFESTADGAEQKAPHGKGGLLPSRCTNWRSSAASTTVQRDAPLGGGAAVRLAALVPHAGCPLRISC